MAGVQLRLWSGAVDGIPCISAPLGLPVSLLVLWGGRVRSEKTSWDAPALGPLCTHVCVSLLGLPVPATLSSSWPGGPCSLQLFWYLCHPTPPSLALVYCVPALRQAQLCRGEPDFGVLHSWPVRRASYRPGRCSLSTAPRFGLVSQLLNPCSRGLARVPPRPAGSVQGTGRVRTLLFGSCLVLGPVLTKPQHTLPGPARPGPACQSRGRHRSGQERRRSKPGFHPGSPSHRL